MDIKGSASTFLITFQRFRKSTNKFSHEFFELMHYTFLAGTFRLLENASHSVFITLLSKVSLLLLFFYFVGAALSLIDLERFEKEDEFGKMHLAALWVLSVLASLLYCWGVFNAVETISILGVKH